MKVTTQWSSWRWTNHVTTKLSAGSTSANCTLLWLTSHSFRLPRNWQNTSWFSLGQAQNVTKFPRIRLFVCRVRLESQFTLFNLVSWRLQEKFASCHERCTIKMKITQWLNRVLLVNFSKLTLWNLSLDLLRQAIKRVKAHTVPVTRENEQLLKLFPATFKQKQSNCSLLAASRLSASHFPFKMNTTLRFTAALC